MNTAPRDLRLLLMAPTTRDGEITRELLTGAGIDTKSCRDLSELVSDLDDGASAVLIAEEHLSGALKAPLAAWLARQAPWSDLPILILTRPGAD